MLKKWLAIGVVLVGVFLFAEETTQDSPAKKEEQKTSELMVTADSMTYSMDNQLIELEGNVLVEDNVMSLTAKKMFVHLDKEQKPVNIEAVGGVTVRKLSTTESASGDAGFYDVKTEIITLRGNCLITKGESSMSGQVVVYNKAKGTILAQRASIKIPLKKGKDGEASPLDFMKNKKD